MQVRLHHHLDCSSFSSEVLKHFVREKPKGGKKPKKYIFPEDFFFGWWKKRRNKAPPQSEHFAECKRLTCLVFVRLYLFLKVNKASADDLGVGREGEVGVGGGTVSVHSPRGGSLRRRNTQSRTKGAALGGGGGGVVSQLAAGGG